MAGRGHGLPDDQRYVMMSNPSPHVDELAQAKREIELLKRADPFNVVEMAIEVEVQRMRVSELMNARDATVKRLSDAYESLRQKMTIIESMEQEPTCSSPPPRQAISGSELSEIEKLKEEIESLQGIIKDLRDEMKTMKVKVPGATKPSDPPPQYDENYLKDHLEQLRAGLHSHPFDVTIQRPALKMAPSSSTFFQASHRSASPRLLDPSVSPITDESSGYIMRSAFRSGEPVDMVKARNSILAALPLPEEVPDDTLSPLSIPATLTLPEFLASLSGSLRTSLANYRLFYGPTTLWCPEREEHGYFYAPIFKCSTNPRVAAAHRWNTVDVINRMNKPTECFFNKDGIWYYAGVYKAFMLDDLTTKEWAELSTETAQAIVKETIAGRRNTSPQNIYEVSQLYAAGALKVACVGLQCVGFNNMMYKALLDQAGFAQSKWKTASPVSVSAGDGLGTGTAWNSKSGNTTERDLVDELGTMSLGRRSADGVENVNMLASRR